ncbi:MAG: Gldg family protein [Treponema sp.]|nr:Gldg family protein [Candidatus Treponema scatequi]
MISKSLIAKDFKSHFVSYIICSLLLFLTSCFQFFIFNRFFVFGYGTSSLSNFFSTIPYVFSLIVPVVVLLNSNSDVENNFPFTTQTVIISKLVSHSLIIIAMVVPLVIVPISVSVFGDVEAVNVITGFSGIFLYAILAVSLCLFVNELISLKPVFLVVSILLLIGIDSIHVIPLYVNCGQFFSNFFNSLSFVWHFDSFSKGIIDTRDFFFYLLSAAVFTVLAISVSEAKKGKKWFSKSLKPYSVLVILIALFAFIDSSRLYLRLDFTKDKQFSVSKYTKDTLKQAKDPVRITYYRSKELVARYPEVRDVYDYLKICANENSIISLSVLDADKKENEDILTSLNIPPQQIQSVNDNRAEYIKIYSAVVIEYQGKKEVLPFVLSTASLQFELNTRFDALIKDKKYNAYLLCGNEYNTNQYHYLEMLLTTSNIHCYPIEKEAITYIRNQLETDVPLIMFGTCALSPEQSEVIEDFILRGGKALIMTSQYSVDINGNWKIIKNVNDSFIPVLEKWGVKFEDKIVNDISNVRTSFVSSQSDKSIETENPQYEYINYPQWISLLPQTNIPNGLTLFWASPIKESPRVTPLFYSSEMSWTVKEFDAATYAQTSELYLTNPFMVEKAPISDPLFIKEVSTVGVQINSKIEGLYNAETNEDPKVIVIPCQYFAYDLLLELAGGENGDFRNTDFILQSIMRLTGAEELSKMQYGGMKNISLYKVTDPNVFIAKCGTVLRFIFLIAILHVAAMITLVIVRKNKNAAYTK